MPLYDYECVQCAHVFEVFHKLSEEGADFACPKCGANQPPFVHLLVITHLLVPDPKGALIGAGGLRYKMACDETRAYLATVSNQEAASGDLQVVNCPGCLAAQKKENFPVIAGSALYLKE